MNHFVDLLDYSIGLLRDYRKDFEDRYDELITMYHDCVLDKDVPSLVGTLPKGCVTIGDIRELMDANLLC